MSARLLGFICLLFAVSALAQEGHPAKGTWVGEWGPSAAEQNRVMLVMDWDGKNITGFVREGASTTPIKLARLDITPGAAPSKPGGNPGTPTFKMHIEAESKDAKGPVTIVADGTMEDVALPSRSLAGTWSQTSGGSTVKGEFRINRQ